MNEEEAPGSRHSKTAVYGIAVVLMLFVYVTSYILISTIGRYEPAAFGSNGVKWHMWAPRGFPDSLSTKHMSWQLLFVPLWLVDSRIWHTSDKAHDPGYRRNQWDSTATPPVWRVVTNPK